MNDAELCKPRVVDRALWPARSSSLLYGSILGTASAGRAYCRKCDRQARSKNSQNNRHKPGNAERGRAKQRCRRIPLAAVHRQSRRLESEAIDGPARLQGARLAELVA